MLRFAAKPLALLPSWSRRLHAVRVLPFLRGDLIASCLLVMIAIVAGLGVADALKSGTVPFPVSLDRLFRSPAIANPYVEVTGLMFPEANLTYPPSTERGRRPVELVYVAMLADDRSKLLLVRFTGDLGHGEARRVVVSGMLQPPDLRLAQQLGSMAWRIAGVPVERRYVLLAGLKPKPLWLFGPIAILSAGMAAAFVVTMIRDFARRPTSLEG